MEIGDVSIKVREPFIDERQQRIAALFRQQREIVAEIRRLKSEMKEGICDECGKPFYRIRVTKRHCSQACNHQAWMMRERKNGSVNYKIIEEALPMLKAACLMTPRCFEILDTLIAVSHNQNRAAEEIGITHQRVQQIAMRATKLGRAALLMKAAMTPADQG